MAGDDLQSQFERARLRRQKRGLAVGFLRGLGPDWREIITEAWAEVEAQEEGGGSLPAAVRTPAPPKVPVALILEPDLPKVVALATEKDEEEYGVTERVLAELKKSPGMAIKVLGPKIYPGLDPTVAYHRTRSAIKRLARQGRIRQMDGPGRWEVPK